MNWQISDHETGRFLYFSINKRKRKWQISKAHMIKKKKKVMGNFFFLWPPTLHVLCIVSINLVKLTMTMSW